MNYSFDRQRLLDNIAFLVKEQKCKVGEVETAVGVSPGYISRISKEGGGTPGIEFISSIASLLKVSIDTLIYADLTKLSPTEQYVVSFLEKLVKDTDAGLLDWNRQSADSLNRQEPDYNGYVGHPLFSLQTFYEESDCEYPNEVTRVVMLSRTFDCHTSINRDCYTLRLKNGAMLFLMDICKSVIHKGDQNAYAKEIWLAPQHGGPQFLCGTKSNPALLPVIENAFSVAAEYFNHPQIRKDLRSVIDSFMNNDWEDDAGDDELPF